MDQVEYDHHHHHHHHDPIYICKPYHGTTCLQPAQQTPLLHLTLRSDVWWCVQDFMYSASTCDQNGALMSGLHCLDVPLGPQEHHMYPCKLYVWFNSKATQKRKPNIWHCGFCKVWDIYGHFTYMFIHSSDVALSDIYSDCFQNTRIPNYFKIDNW